LNDAQRPRSTINEKKIEEYKLSKMNRMFREISGELSSDVKASTALKCDPDATLETLNLKPIEPTADELLNDVVTLLLSRYIKRR